MSEPTNEKEETHDAETPTTAPQAGTLPNNINSNESSQGNEVNADRTPADRESTNSDRSQQQDADYAATIKFDRKKLINDLKPYIKNRNIRLNCIYPDLDTEVRHCLQKVYECVKADAADYGITVIVTKKTTRVELDAISAIQETNVIQGDKDETILVLFHRVCGSVTEADVEAVMYTNDAVLKTIHVPYKIEDTLRRVARNWNPVVWIGNCFLNTFMKGDRNTKKQ